MENGSVFDAAVENAERLVAVCLDNLHDAIFELETERRSQYIDSCDHAIRELKELFQKHPRISADLSEVEEHLTILVENDYLDAQVRIRNLIGESEYQKLLSDYFLKHDYLGQAAELRAKAVECELLGDLDGCWRCFEEIKGKYLLHAEFNRWSTQDTFSLVASVFKGSADFLRKEGRHLEALRHYMYYLANSSGPSETDLRRLPAFLNRSRLGKTYIKEAMKTVQATGNEDGFKLIDAFITRASG